MLVGLPARGWGIMMRWSAPESLNSSPCRVVRKEDGVVSLQLEVR